jgi:sulfite oxidase
MTHWIIHFDHPESPESITRRTFLTRTGQFVLLTGLSRVPPPTWAAQPSPADSKNRLIVRSASPQNLETPIHLLNTWITPNDLFYVRSHQSTPRIDLAQWRLQVDGEVNKPLILTMEDLKWLPKFSRVVTLECAGNGRAFFEPKVPGEQWEKGAIGTARWTGARLVDLLKRAGIKPEAKHVMADGADSPIEQKPDYVRSLPIEKAMHPDTLLAYQMNGEVLPVPHGYPVRLIVPGWTGNHCIKWLTHLHLLDHEYKSDSMKNEYRMPTRYVVPGASVPPKQMEVITSLPIKSLIMSPPEGAQLRAGQLSIMGVAYGGESAIAGVDVSTDLGRTWQSAKLGQERARYAWRRWKYLWDVKKPGVYLVLSRAKDKRGHTQPIIPLWNPKGYLWDVIDKVQVSVL